METNVHFPTDIHLVEDSLRYLVRTVSRLSQAAGLAGWRQSGHIMRKIKRLHRRVQNTKRSRAGSEAKKAEREEAVREAYRIYLEEAAKWLTRVESTRTTLQEKGAISSDVDAEITRFLGYARRLTDQIERRIFKGEMIPQDEKIFSVFEDHTEWISKGKAGVPQELGVKVCVMEDHFGFLLHHRVMEKEEDVEVAVPMVTETKKRFPCLSVCSFDKGFYSLTNKRRLMTLLDRVILPKKGKLSPGEREEESEEAFIAGRRRHSAVESAIHALENHALDVCPDSGMEGFTRYVALAVAARNIQILGHVLRKKELRRLRRKKAA